MKKEKQLIVIHRKCGSLFLVDCEATRINKSDLWWALMRTSERKAPRLVPLEWIYSECDYIGIL